uniref:Phosphodiesterase n=1 Tax=Romanomermis culicivorax TaxID=13658 RepID=A0A915HGD4_ROMCU
MSVSLPADGNYDRNDKFYRFGFMLVKEPTKTALIVTLDDEDKPSTSELENYVKNRLKKHNFQTVTTTFGKILTISKDSQNTGSFEDIFAKHWPHLVVLLYVGQKLSKKFTCFQNLSSNVGIGNSSSSRRSQANFDDLLCTTNLFFAYRLNFCAQIVKLKDDKAFDHGILHLENCQLALQTKLRACLGVFAALENTDNILEITDNPSVVQVSPETDQLITPRIKQCKRASSLDDVPVSGCSDWRYLDVPSPSNKYSQSVCVKQNPLHLVPSKVVNGSCGSRQSSSTLKYRSSVDTPVSEILSLLKELQRKCEDDSSVHVPLQKAVKILNSADLYSPLITRFARDDKVASDLLGGLVLNGIAPLNNRNRKMSLSEAMRVEKNLRYSNRLLRRASPEISAILKTEETWNFNVFDLERLSLKRPLAHLGMKILSRWKVREFLQCSDTCLRAWLDVIEAHYHGKNAYHNSTHAADVLHAAAYYLGKEKIANNIEHADAVASLLAAVVHDVDHPGRGNAFLINSRHSLAILYNDVAVLENHHAALTFQLTSSDHRLNIFAQLTRPEYMALRKNVVDLILATDMNRHFEYLAKFQATMCTSIENNESAPELEPHDSTDHRRIICRILIKCADVSNPTRPWLSCKEWAYRICEEYFAQTAEERAKDLPLTMEVFDRDTCNVPLTQCSFIDMFIRPMFKGWCEFGDMPEMLILVDENYSKWEEEQKTWPEQRDEEFAKLRLTLRWFEEQQQKNARNSADPVINGASTGCRQMPPGYGPSSWSRLSMETATLGSILSYNSESIDTMVADAKGSLDFS